MIFIDGKQIPMHGKSQLTSAVFIATHLRPDSVLTWCDVEGGERPSYEGLKSYAEYVLGPFGKKVTLPASHYRPTHPEIRLAVSKMCKVYDTVAR